MASKVLMEALSPTMEEGRLVEWKKKEGDPVRTHRGDHRGQEVGDDLAASQRVQPGLLRVRFPWR